LGKVRLDKISVVDKSIQREIGYPLDSALWPTCASEEFRNRGFAGTVGSEDEVD
jgi:hypothetical protein